MKNDLLVLLVLVTALVSCDQKSTEAEKECCKPPVSNATASAEVRKRDTTQPLSCTLTSPELEQRKARILSELKTLYSEKRELPNGYSFKFDNSDRTFLMLTDFVKSERQCCNFFDFTISVKNYGVIWFDITGKGEAKEFITTELGL